MSRRNGNCSNEQFIKNTRLLNVTLEMYLKAQSMISERVE